MFFDRLYYTITSMVPKNNNQLNSLVENVCVLPRRSGRVDASFCLAAQRGFSNLWEIMTAAFEGEFSSSTVGRLDPSVETAVRCKAHLQQ